MNWMQPLNEISELEIATSVDFLFFSKCYYNFHPLKLATQHSWKSYRNMKKVPTQFQYSMVFIQVGLFQPW